MIRRSEGLAIESLWEAPDPVHLDLVDTRGGPLPPELAARFAGELTIGLHPDRPTVVANFVTSLDGVVALGPTEPTAGGGEISGFSESDRFVMALLRGLADVVIIGAGTLRAGRRHQWTSRHLQPDLSDVFAAWRAEMWLTPQPTTVVVTGSGNVDATHAGLNMPDVPVVIATTTAGAERLAQLPFARNVRIEAISEESYVPAGALLDLVTRLKARVALCEGGPHLFGEMLRARLIDELFLTVGPQVVGRDATTQRLALVEGTNFGTGHGRWAGLSSVRRAGDDLFLRYRFEG